MADGEIVINSKLDNREFMSNTKQLMSAVKSLQSTTAKIGKDMASSASGYGKSMSANAKAISEVNAQMRDLGTQANALKQKMAQIGDSKIQTKALKDMNKDIEQGQKSLDRLIERQEKMKTLGTAFTESFQQARQAMDYAQQKTSELRETLAETKKMRESVKGELKTNTNAGTGKALTDTERNDRIKHYQELDAAIKKNIEDINKYVTAFNNAANASNRMVDSGEATTGAYKSLIYDIEQARNKQAELVAERDRLMQQEGKGYVLGKDTDEFDKVKAQYDQVIEKKQELEQNAAQTLKFPYVQNWEEMITLSGRVQTAFGQIRNAAGTALMAVQHPVQAIDRALGTVISKAGQTISAFARMAGSAAVSFLKRLAGEAKNAAIQLAKLAANAVSSGLKKIGSAAGNAVKGLLGMNRAQRSSNGGMKTGLKNIMKYAFGIRSMFFLFRRLRAAISEGFGELKKQNPEVKASLDSLQKSFNGLKGSLASAFAPILTAVAPALTTLINMLASAINTIGAFFAALTGKSTYSRAVGGLSNVGKAAGGASKKAKELKRELAGFDELNILNGDNSGGGGGGGGAGFNYQSVPIEDGIKTFVDKLKKLWTEGKYEEVGNEIANGINAAFIKAKDLISWKNVEDTVTEAVSAIAGVFNGLIDPEKGIDFALISSTIGEGIRTIINSANLLLVWIKWANVGGAIARFFNGLIDTVDPDEIANLFVNAFAALSDAIRGFAENFKWGDAGLKFGMTVYNLLMNVPWNGMAYSVGELINGVIEALWNAASGFDWGVAGERFGNAVNTLVGKVNWFKMGQSLAALIHIPIAYLKGAVSKIDWGDAGTKFSDAVNGFFNDETLWTDAGDTINKMVQGILEFGQEFLNGFSSGQAAENLKKAIKKIDWAGIAKQAWTLFKTALAKLGNFITVLFGGEDVEVPVMPVIKPGKKGEKYKIDQYTDSGSEQRNRMDYGIDTSDKNMGTMSSNLADSILKAITSAFGKIPWEEWGATIHDWFVGINWGQIALDIWDAIKAALSGIEGFLWSLLLGEDYQNTTLYQVLRWDKVSARVQKDAEQIKQDAQEASDALGTITDENGETKKVIDMAPIRQIVAAIKGDIANTDTGAQYSASEIIQITGWDKWTAETQAEMIKALGSGYGGVDNALKILESLGYDTTAAQEVLKTGSTLASDFVEGISTGAEDSKTDAENAGASIGDYVEEGIREETDTHSPSKVFEAIGVDLVAGLIEGLKTLPVALQAVWKNLPKWAQALLNSGNVGMALNLGGSRGGKSSTVDKANTKETKRLTKAEKAQTKALGNGLDLNVEGNSLGKITGDGETTVTATVNFVPPKGDDEDSPTGLLDWLSALFEPGVSVFAILEGIASGSLGLSDIFDTILDVVAFLIGKDRDSLGIGDIFNTILDVIAFLSGKDPKSKTLGGVLGTVFDVVAKLTGKDTKSKTLGGVYGTVLEFVSKLTGKANKSNSLEYVYTGTKKSILSFASKLTGAFKNTKTLQSVYTPRGSMGFRSNLKGKADGTNGLVDVYGNKLGVTSNLSRGGATVPNVYGASGNDNYVKLPVKTTLQTDGTKIKVKVQTSGGGYTIGSVMAETVANGGIFRAFGRIASFAKGGAIRSRLSTMFGGINRYAGGTSNAHGTMFLAGEAGPEVVGHVGGRTEVLNKSQIAQAIYSAVVAGSAQAVNALGKYLASHMTVCTNAIITTIGSNLGISGRIDYYAPAMINGGIVPYDVSAQIARSTQEIQTTLDQNNDELIQAMVNAIANAAANIVNAVQRGQRNGTNYTTQNAIDDINRRAMMFNRSPLNV